MARLLTRAGRLILTKVTLTSMVIYPSDRPATFPVGDLGDRQTAQGLPLARHNTGQRWSLSSHVADGL
jgi:hypothetical protein